MSLELLSVLLLLGLGLQALRQRGQRRRMALLAEHLRPYDIEKHMQQIVMGSMRALGEQDRERQTQIWQALAGTEERLSTEFNALARTFAQVPAPEARVLRIGLPGLDALWPQAAFDMRRALEIHAQGLERSVRNLDGLPPRERAYRLMGEMFLMQHSCHWYCKSRMVASARMLTQHQTRYEQTLQAVGEQTRAAYLALVQG
jgi:hypothetical protein